jgi:hypothetical protein
MLDHSQLSLAIGHADVAAHMGFHSSAHYFHTGEIDRQWWKDVRTLGRVIKPLTLAEHAFVTIDGDVIADVTVGDGSTVVVYGKVRSSIQTIGHCELVIAGGVLEGASISADGILHVFVGGDLAGDLRSRGSCMAWIQGNLCGQVRTGHPSTALRVFGDCTATIRPSADPALLYLEVGGRMYYALLEATAAVAYTEFNASVGSSDVPPGLYPDESACASLRQHRSHNRWVIRSLV